MIHDSIYLPPGLGTGADPLDEPLVCFGIQFFYVQPANYTIDRSVATGRCPGVRSGCCASCITGTIIKYDDGQRQRVWKTTGRDEYEHGGYEATWPD